MLELKHKDNPRWQQGSSFDVDIAELREEDRKRDELRKLVNDELKRYGLLMQRMVASKGSKWRTSMNTFILYGQRKGAPGFETRQILCDGNFKECCVEAAKLLDALDAAQLPDTANG